MDYDTRVYNPLDYDTLTRHLVDELMRRGPFDLPLEDAFPGSGVYALFYLGDLPLYKPVRSKDSSIPIYVGKAVPEGSRKGGGNPDDASSSALFKRLKEHCKSIEAAKNIDLADFTCRFLVVTPLWITMAERFLIEHYRPLWNVCVEGFGLHDPGKGRHAGENSWWDTLHPGRIWAKKLKQGRSFKEAEQRVAEHLKAT